MQKCLFLSVFLLVLFFYYGCSNPDADTKNDIDKKLTSVPLKYAKGFTIQEAENYKIITITNPWKGENTSYRYVLYKNQKPRGIHSATFIKVPIQSIACFSLTHVAFLDKLNEIGSINAISGGEYVSSKRVINELNSKKIREIGSEQLINYELLTEIKPDIVMAYGIDESSKIRLNKMNDLGLKVVLNAEYVENHPLGKAEWIKFVAAFYDKDSLANYLYDNIETKYNQLKSKVEKTLKKPTVFVGMPWNGSWYVAGGKSFQAQFLKDAGSNYLWSDNKEITSIVVSKEILFDKAIHADFWLNLNAYNSISEVLTVNKNLKQFDAVKNKQVFNNNLRTNAATGNDYWESGVVSPEIILADLIEIFHPEIQNHHLFYYKKLE